MIELYPSTTVRQDVEAPQEDAHSEFFRQVDLVRKVTRILMENTGELDKLHRQFLSTLYHDEQKRLQSKIDKLSGQTMKSADKIRKLLKMMASENQVMADNNHRDARMRINQTSQLSKKFMETMGVYQESQIKYQKKYSDQLRRQYRAAVPDATDEEIEEVVGKHGNLLLSEELFGAANAMEARKAVDEMQSRHNELMDLEKNIVLLHQLFMDMSMLIDQQSDMVNHIEVQMEESAVKVEHGVGELKQAVEHQKSARKRKWCLIICILILLCVLGTVVYLLFFKDKNPFGPSTQN
jgi:t-SNARE complex subunit (syntaxin)